MKRYAVVVYGKSTGTHIEIGSIFALNKFEAEDEAVRYYKEWAAYKILERKSRFQFEVVDQDDRSTTTIEKVSIREF